MTGNELQGVPLCIDLLVLPFLNPHNLWLHKTTPWKIEQVSALFSTLSYDPWTLTYQGTLSFKMYRLFHSTESFLVIGVWSNSVASELRDSDVTGFSMRCTPCNTSVPRSSQAWESWATTMPRRFHSDDFPRSVHGKVKLLLTQYVTSTTPGFSSADLFTSFIVSPFKDIFRIPPLPLWGMSAYSLEKKRTHRQRIMAFEIKMKANNEGREEVVRYGNFSVLPEKRQVFKEGNTHTLLFESSHQHWIKTSKCLCVGFLKGKLISLFSLILLHVGRSSFP